MNEELITWDCPECKEFSTRNTLEKLPGIVGEHIGDKHPDWAKQIMALIMGACVCEHPDITTGANNISLCKYCGGVC